MISDVSIREMRVRGEMRNRGREQRKLLREWVVYGLSRTGLYPTNEQVNRMVEAMEASMPEDFTPSEWHHYTEPS